MYRILLTGHGIDNRLLRETGRDAVHGDGCDVVQGRMSDMDTVRLQGTATGHGINISDSSDDGVIVGSVEHGSPAHQSDRISQGNLHRAVHHNTSHGEDGCRPQWPLYPRNNYLYTTLLLHK